MKQLNMLSEPEYMMLPSITYRGMGKDKIQGRRRKKNEK